jgi:hypothetical protein
MEHAVAANPTLWDELQRQLQNNWWGVAVLAVAAALLFVGKIAEALKKLAEAINIFWHPSADLLIQALRVGPLPQFRDVAIAAQESVYPVGAQVEFDLRHNGRDTGEIRIDRIEIKLDDYAKEAACPFTLTGDRVFGAGWAPGNVYNVLVSGSGVSSVHYKDPAGKTHKGKTADILALDPPVKLTLHKSETDSVETVQILIRALDSGLYKLSVFLRYTTPKGEGEKKVTSLSICTPST